MSRIEAKYWPAVTYSGKKYAIPHPFVYAQPTGFVFKKDLVDKYSFDYKSVKTIKDLEPFLAKVKAGEPGITPLYVYSAILFVMDYLDPVIKDIVYYNIKTGKMETIYDNPDYIDMWKTTADYFIKGYISKNRISVKDNMAEMKSGKYAVMKDAGAYDKTAQKSTNAFGFPTYETFFTSSIIGTSKVQTVGSSISSTSKNPERAMQFENLLYKDKDFSNHVAYGIEGEDYTVVSGAGTDKPVVQTQKDMKWAIWKCWIDPLWDQWGSNWNSYEALDAMKKGTDSAPVSPILGFTFNTEPVQKEVAQLQSINTEVKNILDFGITPDGDVDKYITSIKDKQKTAGIDTVISEINKQLNEWKSSNGN